MTPPTLDFNETITLVTQTSARFVAIDGLPVSGKSTLAERLEHTTGAQTIYLDDFVRPEADWRGKVLPSFPFAYIRYDDFLGAVTNLAQHGHCTYHPYDWTTGQASAAARTITRHRPIIIEGVSSLHPALAPLYDLRLWVQSDASTTLTAALTRGVGDWEHEWRNLFMPSVELYLQTNPSIRADYLVKGRGV
jgi:uridine kinase